MQRVVLFFLLWGCDCMYKDHVIVLAKSMVFKNPPPPPPFLYRMSSYIMYETIKVLIRENLNVSFYVFIYAINGCLLGFCVCSFYIH